MPSVPLDLSLQPSIRFVTSLHSFSSSHRRKRLEKGDRRGSLPRHFCLSTVTSRSSILFPSKFCFCVPLSVRWRSCPRGYQLLSV
ncbi:hypothetical protein Nepgr_011980 [Nepenthes gracilis]|uniref:Uncharacterized protein n=1 Tax=Nepenthes gracilis TaxID=150966 RepID=A0AAD3XMS0_NEPGR|nr:hypothetical protein Nepgr_011980 [Nepenthes gracilis]